MQADDVIDRLNRLMSEGGGSKEQSSIAAEVDALLAAHEDLVYAICLRFLGEPDRARELCQSVLLTAYLDLAKFRGQEAFTPWLYAIARDQCLAALERGRSSADPILDLVDGQEPLLVALRRQDRITLLHAAAQVLSPVEQDAVHLFYVEGVPRERVNGILGLEQTTDPHLLDSCRGRLAQELRQQLFELRQGLPSSRESGE